jgi:hypothetical protein
MAFEYHWGSIAERFYSEASTPTTQPAHPVADNVEHADKPVPIKVDSNSLPPILGVSTAVTPVVSHVHPPAEVQVDDAAANLAATDTTTNQPLIALPIARAALDYLGADPAAEVVWLTAINDPNMPAEARKNLIEDLDKGGFADPEHPAEADLPLIEFRLNLIEQIRPVVTDDVNAAALDAAYKSLSDLETKLTPPPEPPAQVNPDQPQMEPPQPQMEPPQP